MSFFSYNVHSHGTLIGSFPLHASFFNPYKMDNLDWEDLSNRNNPPILPRSIRGLIVGKLGCGKTNSLLNFLLKPKLLDYNTLFVYGESLFQPKYIILNNDLITI